MFNINGVQNLFQAQVTMKKKIPLRDAFRGSIIGPAKTHRMQGPFMTALLQFLILSYDIKLFLMTMPYENRAINGDIVFVRIDTLIMIITLYECTY